MEKKIPIILLIGYLIYFVVMGIKPYDRAVWIAENIPTVLIVIFLVLTYKKFQFSNTSYIMMSIFIFLHTTGGHFTFEKVPFDFVTNLFSFKRNNFDRVAHFTVGFFAYPYAEFLYKSKNIKERSFLLVAGVSFILAIAAVYEIIEWLYAVNTSPEQGVAFLGSQGDIWDAQKDMLCDGLGAIFAIFIFFIKNHNQLSR